MKQQRTIRRLWMAVWVAAITLVISACDGGGMQKMSNQELVAKSDSCMQNNPTSPGKVTACENIRKECERRRKNGNFAC